MAFKRTTAEAMTLALGGQWNGRSGRAFCPVHKGRNRNFDISETPDGRVLWICRVGCSQAETSAALRALGLSGYSAGPRSRLRCAPVSTGGTNAEDEERTRRALGIWDTSRKARGTKVETYLGSRGLDLPLRARLRFNRRLWHSDERCWWPAMVALVTRGIDDEPIGIHRTYLDRDGQGKARVTPNKMMLGPTAGGAVRLARFDPDLPLMIGEGIETCLAAMMCKDYPAWAALSTSGLRALDLPPNVRDIIVLADGDAAGEAAAQYSAIRWQREGRRCRIAYPPRGMDFNDMLLADRGAA